MLAALRVMPISGIEWRSEKPTRSESSAVSPDQEMARITSSGAIIPRSPWLASVGARRRRGAVEASVAASLRPTWPLLPMPLTMTRPSVPRISSTARSKAAPSGPSKAAITSCRALTPSWRLRRPRSRASSARRAVAGKASAGSKASSRRAVAARGSWRSVSFRSALWASRRRASILRRLGLRRGRIVTRLKAVEPCAALPGTRPGVHDAATPSPRQPRDPMTIRFPDPDPQILAPPGRDPRRPRAPRRSRSADRLEDERRAFETDGLTARYRRCRWPWSCPPRRRRSRRSWPIAMRRACGWCPGAPAPRWRAGPSRKGTRSSSAPPR